jgi:chemotaxis family two-component system sensor kinase Cph1
MPQTPGDTATVTALLAPGSRRRRAVVLGLAAALAAALFALHVAVGDPAEPDLILLVIPVALVGFELGGWAGIAAGLGGLGLFLAGDELNGGTLGTADYVARGAALAVVGGGIGLLATGLRTAARGEEAALAELERRNADLRRSNAELQEFAYVAAHDLQAPLAIVSGFASRLQAAHAERLDPEGREYLDYLVGGTARMQELIDALLAFARAGSAEIVRRPVDCGELVAEVLRTLEPALEERGGEVTANDLPTVEADPLQLRQLLTNLIANAIRFSANTPRVDVQARRADGAWELCVRDHGIGVPPGEAERIFEPLHRAHPDRAGSGIGLAVCRRVVERHGGRIWVEPAPGGGSSFRFTLPDAAP